MLKKLNSVGIALFLHANKKLNYKFWFIFNIS